MKRQTNNKNSVLQH